MRLNLMTAGVLLALAACDDKGGGDTGDDTVPTVEPDDTAPEGGTDTAPETAAPWPVFGYAFYFEITVDESGNLVPFVVNGAENPPALFVSFSSEDFFYDGEDEETCDVVLDLTGATLSATPREGMYATWTIPGASAPVIFDGCSGVSGTILDVAPLDYIGELTLEISLGAFDDVFWYTFFYQDTIDDYLTTHIGGNVTDGLYIDTPIISQGFPLDPAGGYIPEPYLPADVPSATGGVTAGFYYGFTINTVGF